MKQLYAGDTDIAAGLHRDCFSCRHGEDGLGMTFDRSGVDAVSDEWFCEEKYQSYLGIMHGGIIATILDSAMTNCLLMKGISAVTADMHIEYLELRRVGKVMTVNTALVSSRSPLFMLDAEVIQHGRVSTRASAKFVCADVWLDTSHVQ